MNAPGMLIFIDWHQLQRNGNGRASAQGGVELIHISKKQLLCHSAQPTLKLFTWTCVQLHWHQCPSDPDDKRSNDTLDGSACHGQSHAYRVSYTCICLFQSFRYFFFIFNFQHGRNFLRTTDLKAPSLACQKQTAVTQSKQAASSPFNVSIPRNHPITAVNVH